MFRNPCEYYQFIFHRQQTYALLLGLIWTFGSAFILKETNKRARFGQCVMRAISQLHSLVKLQICGDISSVFTVLRRLALNKVHVVRKSELSIHFSQTSQHLLSRSRSKIWNHFELKEDYPSRKRLAVCPQCHTSLVFIGSTFNTWRHFRRAHSIKNLSKF